MGKRRNLGLDTIAIRLTKQSDEGRGNHGRHGAKFHGLTNRPRNPLAITRIILIPWSETLRAIAGNNSDHKGLHGGR